MIPYAEIVENGDRHWTRSLIGRLRIPHLPDAEQEEVVRALRVLSDPRATAALHEILTDRGLPGRTRRAASSVLFGLDWGPDPVPEEVRHCG